MFEVLFFKIKMLLNILIYEEWLYFCDSSYVPKKEKEYLALKAMPKFTSEFLTFEGCRKACMYINSLEHIQKIILEENMIKLAKTSSEWSYVFYKAKYLKLNHIVKLAIDNMIKLADGIDDWVNIYIICSDALTESIAINKIKELVRSFKEWNYLFNIDNYSIKEFSFGEMYCSAKTFDEWFIIYKISRDYSKKEENLVALSKIKELAQYNDLLVLIGYSSRMPELEEVVINKILTSEFTQEEIVSLYERSEKNSKTEKLLLSTKLCCRRK